MLPFASILHRAGYASLLFDARNHGKSDPDDFSSLPKFAEDLGHAMDWLEARPETAAGQVAVLGHSVGAAAALLTAARRRPAAVVSIAAFAHPALLMRRVMAAHHVPYWPIGRWVLRRVEQEIGARFDEIAPTTTIQKVTCPVLLVHGEHDARVPLADAWEIYGHRRSDGVRLWVLPDAGHDSVHQIEEYGAQLADFLRDALG